MMEQTARRSARVDGAAVWRRLLVVSALVASGMMPSGSVSAASAGDTELSSRAMSTGGGAAGSASMLADVADGARSVFVPLTPARLLDTRATVPLGPDATIELPVLGRAGVPNWAGEIAAAVLTVTITGAKAAGFVSAYPAGADRPNTSSLNVEGPGRTVANLVTVPVGADGSIALYSSGGGHLLADIAGYYRRIKVASNAGRFQPTAPTRILDTRGGEGILPGATRVVRMAGTAGVPAVGAAAVSINLTVTQARRAGFVTAYPAAGGLPEASNLNVNSAGDTVAGAAVVPLDSNGNLAVLVDAGGHLLIDVNGWFTDASAPESTEGVFIAQTPSRQLDTRSSERLAAKGNKVLPVPSGAIAVSTNLTLTGTAQPGFLTAYPSNGSLPGVSSLNATYAGHTVANHAIVPASTSGIRLYADMATDVLADVDGYYLGDVVEPPQPRFPGLAKVGNLSMWFTLFWATDNPAGDPGYLPDAEIARIVAHGFTGVRLPIDPELIADEWGTVRPAAVAKVQDAVDRLQAHGLAVVIDLHIWDPDNWESPEQVQRAEWIWKQLAPIFRDYDPALTFLELYNEPGWWSDPTGWAPYEQSMYDVVRGLAPNLPIMLSGPLSSWVDGLPDALTVNDPNVVYTIHIYDPFAFTHQGADWVVDPGLTAARAIPFPATPQACATAIANQPTPGAAAVVTEYCSHGYDAAWVRGRIATAAAWAASHDAAVFIGEFGVSPTASVDDAARWFAAVATAAEEFEMGWGIWSIDSAMGIRRSSGWTTSFSDNPDPALLAALGLFPA